MRVITGTAKGRRLVAPDGLDTRPTSDMTKETIFSAIQFEIPNALTLDLFAGSGQLGIEALSRGARFAVFVDSNRSTRDIIRGNLEHTGFLSQSRVVTMDAFAYLATAQEEFDIVLADPPYGSGLAEKTLAAAVKKTAPGGIILLETEKNEATPEEQDGFRKVREYRSGRAKISLYRKQSEEEL